MIWVQTFRVVRVSVSSSRIQKPELSKACTCIFFGGDQARGVELPSVVCAEQRYYSTVQERSNLAVTAPGL
jgi:hypothetical protein